MKSSDSRAGQDSRRQEKNTAPSNSRSREQKVEPVNAFQAKLMELKEI
jgi:hypothetical protein